jgi:formylglycine-generating enzyme required for sulfatase activity
VEFRMGSPPTETERFEDEIPHRRIIPRRFAMAAKEVTVEEYREFVKENSATYHVSTDRNSPDPAGPMNGRSWYDAAAYCNWRSRREGLPECYQPNGRGEYATGMKIKPDALRLDGYRLPTEAEWEYACRAGTDSDYSFGEARNLGDYAWFADNSAKKTHPVGTKKANPWGLFDMHGNVVEWCQDVFDKACYKSSPSSNPHGPASGKEYVLRGGSWKSPAEALRSAYRSGETPGFSDACLARDAIGFRCVRKAPVEDAKDKPAADHTDQQKTVP